MRSSSSGKRQMTGKRQRWIPAPSGCQDAVCAVIVMIHGEVFDAVLKFTQDVRSHGVLTVTHLVVPHADAGVVPSQ